MDLRSRARRLAGFSLSILAFAATAATAALADSGLVDHTLPGGAAPAAPSTGLKPPGRSPLTIHVLDDFNRADGPLGPNWTLTSGDMGVVSDAARGTLSQNYNLATFNGGLGSDVEADVDDLTTGLEYSALVLEYLDENDNLFLKVQNNGNANGQYDAGACYYGDNGLNGSFGLSFFSLSAPFTTAHMSAVVDSGRNVTITFSNIDGGGGTQTYVCSGAPVSGGTAIGIGAYNTLASLDNFAGGAVSPLEAVPAVGHTGLAVLALLIAAAGVAWLIHKR